MPYGVSWTEFTPNTASATLELTFLGSGNAFAPAGRYRSSFLVNGRYLFDAPPTLLPHLKRLGRPPVDIRVVFISHFHGDHFMGLPFLFLEFKHVTPRQDDLYIVGPAGVQGFSEEFADRCFPGLSGGGEGYRRVYVDASPGRQEVVDEVSFQAAMMNHGGGRLACFGYRVTVGDKTLAYTGDTMYCEEIFELAQDSDVLVIDCSYDQGTGPEHLGFDEVRQVRRQVDPVTTMILTHLGAEPDISRLDNVILAQDFATYHF